MATLIAPSGGSGGTATPLATTAPLTDVPTAAVGTGTEAARADHRHALGGVLHHRFVTGRWYGAHNPAFSNAVLAAGVLHTAPFYVPNARTFDGIRINVTTAGVGPVRLGVYNDNGSHYPGSLLLSAGTVDSAVLGELVIAITQALEPGVYWPVALTETTTNGAYTLMSSTTLGMPYIPNGNVKGYEATAVAAGALPATFPSVLATTANLMRVQLRAA